jgi:hypothetical protein
VLVQASKSSSPGVTTSNRQEEAKKKETKKGYVGASLDKIKGGVGTDRNKGVSRSDHGRTVDSYGFLCLKLLHVIFSR